jgi:hypothetical protein
MPQPAQADVRLPAPGAMVNLSPAFQPALIKGLTIHKDNPFLFDFIVDTGHSNLQGDALKEEGDRLIKYFFASLTIPENDMWVNLSPYERDRTVPSALGKTALGRDLLAQDYLLKQLTASLIYPEQELGKDFWNRVYAKAQAMYGTSEVPINTFNKVWIMADKATVYEHNQTAFVVDGHLKVMLEEDYLAAQKNVIPLNAGVQKNSVSSQVVRDIILPEIEKEVNQGKNFAMLRQIFQSQILATWYKKNLKEALLNQVYTDHSTVSGVNLSDTSDKEKIYEQYLEAYKKGVFNYIKISDTDSQKMPRKYFSGGYKDTVSEAMVVVRNDAAMASGATKITGNAVDFATVVQTSGKASLEDDFKNIEIAAAAVGLSLKVREIKNAYQLNIIDQKKANERIKGLREEITRLSKRNEKLANSRLLRFFASFIIEGKDRAMRSEKEVSLAGFLFAMAILSVITAVRVGYYSNAPQFHQAAEPVIPDLSKGFQLSETGGKLADIFSVKVNGEVVGNVVRQYGKEGLLNVNFTYGNLKNETVAYTKKARFFGSSSNGSTVYDHNDKVIGSIELADFVSAINPVQKTYKIRNAQGQIIATSVKTNGYEAEITFATPDGRIIGKIERNGMLSRRYTDNVWTATAIDPKELDPVFLLIMAAYRTSKDNDHAMVMAANIPDALNVVKYLEAVPAQTWVFLLIGASGFALLFDAVTTSTYDTRIEQEGQKVLNLKKANIQAILKKFGFVREADQWKKVTKNINTGFNLAVAIDRLIGQLGEYHDNPVYKANSGVQMDKLGDALGEILVIRATMAEPPMDRDSAMKSQIKDIIEKGFNGSVSQLYGNKPYIRIATSTYILSHPELFSSEMTNQARTVLNSYLNRPLKTRFYNSIVADAANFVFSINSPGLEDFTKRAEEVVRETWPLNEGAHRSSVISIIITHPERFADLVLSAKEYLRKEKGWKEKFAVVYDHKNYIDDPKLFEAAIQTVKKSLLKGSSYFPPSTNLAYYTYEAIDLLISLGEDADKLGLGQERARLPVVIKKMMKSKSLTHQVLGAILADRLGLTEDKPVPVVSVTSSPDVEALNPVERMVAKFTNGGIDLNSNNMGLTINKDANGGVKVSFDPAMAEQIRNNGLTHVEPVIIRMTPIKSEMVPQLLGV